mgnify:CR=1 FL=1
MKIYFTIADEKSVIQDRELRGLGEIHYWRQDASDEWFGVCILRQNSYGDEAAERLEALGADLLPALNDPAGIQAKAAKNLFKKHGIAATDSARDIATKIHGVSGFRPLKPNKY